MGSLVKSFPVVPDSGGGVEFRHQIGAVGGGLAAAANIRVQIWVQEVVAGEQFISVKMPPPTLIRASSGGAAAKESVKATEESSTTSTVASPTCVNPPPC